MKKEIFIVTYGEKQKTFHNETEAKNFAYEQGFYYSIKVNNIPYIRQF